MSRIRRVRVRPTFDAGKADTLLQSIAKAREQAAIAEQQAATAEAALFDLLHSTGVQSHQLGNILAEIVRPAGKAANIIDPKALRSLLDDKSYYACVSVSVTKAKEYLSAKELAGITTTIPGTTGPSKLKITIKGK